MNFDLCCSKIISDLIELRVGYTFLTVIKCNTDEMQNILFISNVSK